MTESIRLQKYLSQCGIASRRQAETYITAGRVTVNGKVTTVLGSRIDPDKDVVEVDHRKISPPKTPIYVVMNKPRATVCTEHDPQGRDKVHDLLPKSLPRLFTVGRLDYDSEGVLLFTTDGEMAQRLTTPDSGVPKVYEVKIQGPVDEHVIRRFNEGVRLDDGRRTKPAICEVVRTTRTNAWYEVVLTEGKNRQIHRMAMACGKTVLKLRRTMFGPISLGFLKPGEVRPLRDEEIEALTGVAGLKSKRRAEHFKEQLRTPRPERADAKTAKPARKSKAKPERKASPEGKPERKPKTVGRTISKTKATGKPKRQSRHASRSAPAAPTSKSKRPTRGKPPVKDRR